LPQFLAGRLSFGQVAERIADALEDLGGSPRSTLEELLDADAAARHHVQSRLSC
jgi:1-deoxy-D-xylulose-5-phosphate reductoisomerase